jgi:GNAT superfamily N-acetyltransferase
MGPSITIRRARRADLPALAAVDPLLVTEAGRADHIGELLDVGLSWLAEADGAAAGYVVVTRHFFGHPFVDLLVVAEAQRRQGIGGVLMGQVEDSHDGDRLFTSTNESNAAMRTLLAQRGYDVSGIIENLDPGDPELVFVKFRP